MNCRDLLGAVHDYLDDEQRAEICKEIERHLEDCPHCKVHVDTLRGTVALVREKSNNRCCEKVVLRLRTRILTVKAGPSRPGHHDSSEDLRS